MTSVNISIEQGKSVIIRFDVLAREDATDDELKWARVIEDALIGVFKALPELKAKVTRDESGDGHDKIRSRSGR